MTALQRLAPGKLAASASASAVSGMEPGFSAPDLGLGAPSLGRFQRFISSNS